MRNQRHKYKSLSLNDAAKNLHNIHFWYQLLLPGWKQNIGIVIFNPKKHVKVHDLQKPPNPNLYSNWL